MPPRHFGESGLRRIRVTQNIMCLTNQLPAAIAADSAKVVVNGADDAAWICLRNDKVAALNGNFFVDDREVLSHGALIRFSRVRQPELTGKA